MDLPEELEIAKVQYPCLLSVDKDIFQPRLPSYVKKMDTADREIEVYSLDDMEDKDETHYGLNGSPTQVKRISLQQRMTIMKYGTETEVKSQTNYSI